MTCGIYMIENVTNGKVYVGRSQNVERRFIEHRRDLRAGTAKNPHLQAAWNNHGKEAFVFKILEACSIDCICLKEVEWIEHYDAYNQEKGYNLRRESTDGKAVVFSQESREKMRQAALGRKRSEESKRKTAEGNRGRKRIDTQKMKEAQRNRSEEWRENMRNAQRARREKERKEKCQSGQ